MSRCYCSTLHEEHAVRRPRGRPGAGARIEESAVHLSVFVCSGDRFAGRPVYAEVVDRARLAGLGGATVRRGLAGFGSSGRLHPASRLRLGDSVPVLIEIVAAEASVRAFLPVLDEVVGSGLVTLSPLTVYRQAAADAGDRSASAAS